MLSSLESPAADSLRLKLYSNRAAAQLRGRNLAAVEADVAEVLSRQSSATPQRLLGKAFYRRAQARALKCDLRGSLADMTSSIELGLPAAPLAALRRQQQQAAAAIVAKPKRVVAIRPAAAHGDTWASPVSAGPSPVIAAPSPPAPLRRGNLQLRPRNQVARQPSSAKAKKRAHGAPKGQTSQPVRVATVVVVSVSSTKRRQAPTVGAVPRKYW